MNHDSTFNAVVRPHRNLSPSTVRTSDIREATSRRAEGEGRMYINRAKALLLVGTISAGCAGANDDDAAAGGTGNEADGHAGTSGVGLGGTDGQLHSAGAGGVGGAGGDAGAAGTTSAGGMMNIGGTTSEGICDDDAVTPMTCDELQYTACEGLEEFLSVECEMVASVMKPALAHVARSCMVALSPPELCDPTNIYACMDEALSLSCPDAEAEDECTAIVSVCDESLDSPLQSECNTLLAGMTQGGRDQMVQCMADFCDLYTCIEGLTYPLEQ